MNGAYAIRYTAFDFDYSPSAMGWVEEVGVEAEVSPGRRIMVEMYGRARNVWEQVQDCEVRVHPSISLEDVKRIFALLPPGLPEVDAYTSHLGSICLDWDNNPENVFSLIIKPNGHVGYACYFNGERTHGSIFFEGRLGNAIDRAVERWIIREQLFCGVN
ncbi:hypothetical protein [Stenotrophomonas pigmentata]|uniref:hypothetical protein n=1 Tax=Stenotrophomonas pigmentata TaxID=3055080 RepID=UPI0026F260EE|nr:hypothetical protein [Stenotrophomonas sp. 610A2]